MEMHMTPPEETIPILSLKDKEDWPREDEWVGFIDGITRLVSYIALTWREV